MEGKKSIEHPGIVETIEDGKITVNVIAESACASCHAKGSCSVGDVENKQVEIYSQDTSFTSGERVMVKLSQSLGFRALMFGYVIPFIIIIISLLITLSLEIEEGIAGLIAIGTLPVYYYGLYLMKDRMKQVFSFSIHKIV